jgi:hypothetical protein
MFEHTRTRSGKYPNHAHQFKCCNSFISDSSLVICYRFVLLDRAWPHMYPTTLLSLKPESYRQVNLAQTLERNRTATSKNQSKPDPSQPTTSTKPSKLCSTPQHLKKYLQKVAQTITPSSPAYTEHIQNWQYHTPTLPKHSHKQHPSTPTQTNLHSEPTHNQKTPNYRPPKTPETRNCRPTPLNYVVPSTQLITKRPHKQNLHSLQTLNSRQTIQTPSPYPAQNNQRAGTKPQKPPTPCLTLTQYLHTQIQPIHKSQQLVVIFPKKIQTPRTSKNKSNLSILDTAVTQPYETVTQHRNTHLSTNPTMCRNQEGGQLIRQQQKQPKQQYGNTTGSTQRNSSKIQYSSMYQGITKPNFVHTNYLYMTCD